MKFNHLFIAPKDWGNSLDFYSNEIGFAIVSEWGNPQTGRGAVLKNGDIMIVIAEEHKTDNDHAWEAGFINNRPTLHVNVDDVDAIYNNLNNKEFVIIPPEDNHWSGRWMVIKDPDDNLIAYNTPQID